MSVRQRRRDLAVLRVMGFARRDLVTTVAWAATTLGLVAVGVGVPLGVIAGRAAWSWFTARQGFVAAPRTPLLALAIAAPITVVLANAVALLPGLQAASIRPAAVLRDE